MLIRGKTEVVKPIRQKLQTTLHQRQEVPNPTPAPQSRLPIARTASGCIGSASSEGSLHAPQGLCVHKKGKKDLESPNYFSLLLLLFFLLIIVSMQLLWLAFPYLAAVCKNPHECC